MKGRPSAGLAYGAILAALILSVFLLCGCADVERRVVQREISSIPEVTTTYSPTTSPAVATTVLTTPIEEIIPSSVGTPTTLTNRISDSGTFCMVDCEGNKNPQFADLCLRAYANACKDMSICGGIQQGDDRDSCYNDLAGKTKIFSICERISGNNTKALCKAGFYNNSSICREITNADMQCDCYLSKILPEGNLSQCENVLPTACRGLCFYEYAVKYDMPELCRKAGNGSSDSCYRSVAAENMDLFACANVRIQSIELCYLDMAVGLQDISICDNLTYSEKGYKYWCLAAAGRNVSLCDRVAKDKWSDCIYYVARLTGDESICEKTNDKTGSCYIALAEYGKDPAYCEKIKVPSEKDRCYASSAAARYDISLCKNITDQNYKKECYGSFIQDNAREMLLGGKTRIFS
jgi:hypothetical protein